MKIISKILLLLLSAGFIFAQGGSVYSRYAAGNINNFQSARQLGLAGSGISVASSDYINNFNPASWNQLNVTRMEAGLNFTGLNLSNSSESSFYSNADFNGFSIGVPVEKNLGIAVVLGIMPYSNVNYEIEEINPNSEDYNLVFSGKGGITKIYFGFSYRLPFGIALGASLDYYTGTIDNYSQINFNSGSNMHDTYFNYSRKFNGVGFTFGAISNNLAESLNLNSIKDFRLGASVTTQTSINTDTTLATGIVNGLITDENGQTETVLPMRINIGSSLIFNDKYSLQLDYSYQPWNDYRFADGSSDQLTDMHRISLGFEIFGENNLYTDFSEKIDLRFGLAFEKTHLNIKDEDINQLSVHAGFSIPVGYWSTMDFGFMYGKRGTTDSGLLQEDIYKASVSLSIGELWFVRVQR